MNSNQLFQPPAAPAGFFGPIPNPIHAPVTQQDLMNAISFKNKLGSYASGGHPGAAEAHAEATLFVTNLSLARLRQTQPATPTTTLDQILENLRNINSTLGTLTGGLATANDRLNTMQAELAGMTTQLTTISTKTETLATKTETLATKTETLATKTETLASKTETLATKTETLATKTETLATKTETLATREEVGALATKTEVKAGLDKLATKSDMKMELEKTRTEMKAELDKMATTAQVTLGKLDATATKTELKAAQAEVASKLEKLSAEVDLERIDQRVQSALSTSVAGFRTDVLARLDAIDGKVETMSSELQDIHKRAITTERTQRLQINFGRGTNGPWLVVPNAAGQSPTESPYRYRHLRTPQVVNELTNRALHRYLVFYELPPPSTSRVARTLFNNPDEWSAEYKSQRATELIVYISNLDV